MAEEVTSTSQRRFSAVWIGGSVITGLLCGLSLAVFHTAWVAPTLVLLGAGVLTTLFFRFWWRGETREQALAMRTRTEGVVGFLVSGLMFGFFGFVMVLGVATARPSAVHFPQTGWDEIARLVMGGAVSTALLAPLLCGCGMAIILLRRGDHGDSVKRP